MFDEIDRKILSIVQSSARTNNAEIARQVGMAPSAVLERVRKLESRGVILGYRALLDAESLGLGLLAFVFVKTNEKLGDQSTGDQLAAVPGVLETHHVAGEDCYLIKVRAASPEALSQLLREELGQIPTVVSTRSTIVLHSIKEAGGFPIGSSD